MGSLALASASAAARFDLAFLEAGRSGLSECRRSLATCWNTRFECVPPVRQFPSYQGQKSFPGSWWASSMDALVGFESWLERDQVMMLDFSPQVTAFSSQPFWLRWVQRGQSRRHAPDFFARLRDGTGVVIDVRADDRIEPEDAEAFAATARACESVGWQYRRVGVVDAVLAANVRWLAGYRHPRCRNPRYADLLLQALCDPGPLLARAGSVGDPVAVLPTLFHLMWSRRLRADLESCPLSGGTMVVAAGVDG